MQGMGPMQFKLPDNPPWGSDMIRDPGLPWETVKIKLMPLLLWDDLAKLARRRKVPRERLVKEILAAACGHELDYYPSPENWDRWVPPPIK